MALIPLTLVFLSFGFLLPTGREEREVSGVGSIPVATLPSCQFMNNIAG